MKFSSSQLLITSAVATVALLVVLFALPMLRFQADMPERIEAIR